MSKAKAKGTAAETAVVKYLRGVRGFDAMRKPLQGNQDGGDIAIAGMDIVIEVKNQKTLSIPAWLREVDIEIVNAGAKTGILIVKPKGIGYDNVGKWWVIQRLEDFDL